MKDSTAAQGSGSSAARKLWRATPQPVKSAVKRAIAWGLNTQGSSEQLTPASAAPVGTHPGSTQSVVAEQQPVQHSPRIYYVDRYLIPGYGTQLQLEEGLRDHRSADPVPGELLDRLICCWAAMKKAEACGIPTPYVIAGEWRGYIDDAFLPLTRALDSGDKAELSAQLKDFFRRYGLFFGEPVQFADEAVKRERCQQFRVYVSRWTDLYGVDALPEAQNPRIGNPMGFVIDDAFYTPDSLRHDFYAKRMVDLVGHIAHPCVCEVGGGFGGFAYHLLRQPGVSFRYVDYDIPVIAIAAAYYLVSACPDKRIRLFGEVDAADPLADCDAAIMPHFALQQLRDLSVDACFNTCSFAEMDEGTVVEYMQQFARVSRLFIMNEDHSWNWDSRNAVYQPSTGFKHWRLSRMQPPADSFRRLYRIPSPFHSDLYGEFFEWLYVRLWS